MDRRRARQWLISVFVVCWAGLFHYETVRLNYLTPLLRRELPKTKFLYPPAGWIMFFNVDPSYGMAEVYALRQGQAELLDPHDIFRTRFVWYDNIRRNVLIGVLSPRVAPQFCRYLRRRFPDAEAFAVVYRAYPDVAAAPEESRYQVQYRCQ
ncbi:MAG: hypothetical protein HYY15_04450 [Candidatus Omnitrophica bacterium]|nr:hypothetical protein [Candidatus Omnitrophota bacterium]